MGELQDHGLRHHVMCGARQAVEDLFSHLGLSTTGETEDDPESRFSSARLTTGWRLIWSNQYNCPVLTKGLSTFAGHHDIVACQIEEHIMASSAELWTGGTRSGSCRIEPYSGMDTHQNQQQRGAWTERGLDTYQGQRQRADAAHA